MAYAVTFNGTLTADDDNVYWSPRRPTWGRRPQAAVDGRKQRAPRDEPGTVLAIAVDEPPSTGRPSGHRREGDHHDGAMEVLTSGQQRPRGIAVGDGDVYWNNGGGTVTTLRTSGGSPTPLASAQVAGSGRACTGIAVDATTVYWADATANRVMRVPTGGGCAIAIAGASTPGVSSSTKRTSTGRTPATARSSRSASETTMTGCRRTPRGRRWSCWRWPARCWR